EARLVAARRRFGNHADAHAGGDDPAYRIEAVDPYPDLHRLAQRLAHLGEERLQGAAGIHADQVLVEHLGELDPLAPREAVAGGGGEHELVGAEVHRLQAEGVDPARDDADVGAALEHPAGDVGIGLFLDLHVDGRIAGGDPGQDRREDVGDGGGVGEDPQVPAQAPAVLLEVGAQVLDLPKD